MISISQPLIAARYWLVVLTSFCLTGAVVWNAFLQKQQFYPSIVYLSKSTISLAVIHMQAFVLVLLLGKVLCKLFFGALRETEVEHLIEKGWYVLTETCLAFTVFRDDFSSRFVAMFTILLIAKCFHWLLEDRIDLMERSLNITMKFHVRVISLIILLSAFDIAFIRMAYSITVAKGASAQLVFGFEYSILLVSTWMIAMKYIVHVVDMSMQNSLENKTAYFLYMELVANGGKVVIYSAFMFIMVAIHTFPLFAIRPMYLATKAFRKACYDVIMSRRAIRYLNTMFEDANPEDLTDTLCAVCREEMTTNLKRLPCGHVFHAHCLRSWFQRQQTCPTCRIDVLRHERTLNMVNNDRGGAAAAAGGAADRRARGFAFGFGAARAGANNVGAAGATPGSGSPSATGAGSTASLNLGNGMNMRVGGAGGAPMFMIPPPAFTPLPNLQAIIDGMSDEELAAMEGSQRRNVQARIECLTQIQVLLDAAVTQMNQYSAIVGNLEKEAAVSAAASSSSGKTKTKSESKASSSNDQVSSSSSTTKASNHNKTSTTSVDEESTSPISIKRSSDSMKVEVKSEPVTKTEPESSAASSAGDLDDPMSREELRKRRVEKLQTGSAAGSGDSQQSSAAGSASNALVTDQDLD